MRTPSFRASISAMILVASLAGCRRNKVAAPPPAAAPTYARPTTSPVATTDTALKLRGYFPVDDQDKFDQPAYFNANSHDNIRPHIFTVRAGQNFTLNRGSLDDCETACKAFLAELEKELVALGGSATAAKVDRAGDRLTVSSTYALPKRNGKVDITVEPRPERTPESKRLTVWLVEEAEGEKTP